MPPSPLFRRFQSRRLRSLVSRRLREDLRRRRQRVRSAPRILQKELLKPLICRNVNKKRRSVPQYSRDASAFFRLFSKYFFDKILTKKSKSRYIKEMRRESDNALISTSNFFEPCFFGLRRVDFAIKRPASPSTFARHSRYTPFFPSETVFSF